MTVHNLTKTQVIVKDRIDEPPLSQQCNCSERITDLETTIKQLKALILNGRNKNISNSN